MRKPNNPFIITGYHSPAYFCDRDKELKWLGDQIKNERNVVLYSWRRMGKTALIRHFFNRIKNELKTEGVFVDLLGTTSITDANKRIASAIISQLGDLKRGIGQRLIKLMGAVGATLGVDPLSGMPVISFGLNTNQKSVSDSLEAIGTFLVDYKKPIVVCIDEFQQIVNYPEGNAEATFRTWAQNYPLIRFIFSGSHREMMISMFNERSRPFYKSAQILQLNELPADQYIEFIIKHFKKAGKKINPENIESIFNWTRLQTYYVQLVCNKLFGKSDNITEDVLDEVFKEIILQEAPLYSSYQQLLTTLQWKLLLALARDEEIENPYSQQFINRHQLGAASSVRRALEMLKEKEFVIDYQQKYFIHDTLLMRWLQQL
jgi:AAA+ ATPase superfamily predicted ATPase